MPEPPGKPASMLALPVSSVATTDRHRSLVPAIVLCTLAWALTRYLFFTGITGSDDIHYMRFAAMWDRAPVNHWEARLLGNALTWLSMRLFGRGELAAALPSLMASLTILACAMYAAHRYAGGRAVWWAGLLAAVLPIDVYLATTVSPFIVMTALVSVGTLAFLNASQSRVSRIIAAAALALGVVTHLSGVYYVAALAAAGLWLDRRRYAGVIAMTLVAGVIVIAIDMGVFHFVYDDAFGRFRTCLVVAGNPLRIMPTTPDGSINPTFLTRPVISLLFSKAFGVSLSVTLLVVGLAYRRLPHAVRLLWITTVILWLWISYGSLVPWAYRPFWRMSRFLHPLTLALTLMFGASIAARPALRTYAADFLRVRVLGPFVVMVCLLNLLASGSWGQNARISRELLDYTRAHLGTRFLTDYRTLNEMHVLNHVQTLPNVATTGKAARYRILDPRAPFAWPIDLKDYDEILINPLNLEKNPAFAALAESSGGELRFETTPAYRPICRLLRPLRRFAWAVRKPPARVVAFSFHGKLDAIAASDAPTAQAATP